MGTRIRPSEAGSEVARRLLGEVGRELRVARVDRNLSLRLVARSAGISATTISRLERGLVRNASVVELAKLHLAVGLDLSVKSFPGGQPVRDAAHVSLLSTFRGRLHGSLRFVTEVPLPIASDRRAWDGVISGPGFRIGVECETAPRDVQATLRRIALKVRDSGMDGSILLLADTVQARRFLVVGAELLRDAFPVDGEVAIERLSTGLDPGGSAVIMLRRRHRPAAARSVSRQTRH